MADTRSPGGAVTPATIVFAGPSLVPLGEERRDRLLDGMDLRPPARRGDVTSALAEGADTIVLLDGYFFHELSVAHKELLYALECGTRVIGAASMGALRAAEMSVYGMAGVGEIYGWYAGGVIDGDDEVAVMHAPDEYGYGLQSVALVEVRHALGRLAPGAPWSEDDAGSVVRALKKLGFAERTAGAVSRAAGDHLGEDGAAALLAELDRFSVKAEDAAAALRVAREPWRRREDPAGSARRSMFFYYWCEDHVRAPAAAPALPRRTTLLHALSMVQLFHDDAPRFVEDVRLRYLAASAARRAGLEAAAGRADEIAATLSRYMEDEHGGPVLPAWVVEDEARVQALAETACAEHGDAAAAGDWLASAYGLSPGGGHRKLLDLLESQYGRLTSWSLARALTFSTLLRPALEVAEAADEVFECYREWSRGARISRDDLRRVAAMLWSCPVDGVEDAGGRRGLVAAHGFSVGLWEVLKRATPAERLPRPINAYPELRTALHATPLVLALPLLPAARPTRAATATGAVTPTG